MVWKTFLDIVQRIFNFDSQRLAFHTNVDVFMIAGRKRGAAAEELPQADWLHVDCRISSHRLFDACYSFSDGRS